MISGVVKDEWLGNSPASRVTDSPEGIIGIIFSSISTMATVQYD